VAGGVDSLAGAGNERSALRRRVFRLILATVVIAATAWLIDLYWADLTILMARLPPGFIAVQIALQVVVLGYGAYSLRPLLAARGFPITTRDVVALSYIGNFARYLAPLRPDLPIRFAFLRHRCGVPLMETAAVSLGFAAYLLGISVLFVIVLLPIAVSLPGFPPWSGFAAVGALGAAAVLAGRVMTREAVAKRIPKSISNGFAAVATMVTPWPLFLRVAAHFAVFNLLWAATYYTVFTGLGIKVGLVAVVIFGPATTLLNLASLTPANIGLRETFIGFLSQVTIGDFAPGFLVGVLLRAGDVLVSLALGASFAFLLIPSKER